MKGRNNYLCRQKLYDLTDAARAHRPGRDRAFPHHPRLGEDHRDRRPRRDDLPARSQPALAQARRPRRTCTGQKCQQFERCFITEMHRRAAESDIIIVNHHLFFADLAIKQAADGAPDAGILPEAGGGDLRRSPRTRRRGRQLLRRLGQQPALRRARARRGEHAAHEVHCIGRGAQRAGAALRERSQLFFSLVPAGEGRFAFENRREFLEENGDEYLALQNALQRLDSELQRIPEKPEEVHNLIRRTEELRVQLGFLLESQDRNTVFWIERRMEGRRREGRPSHVFLQATPIDVSQILRQTLFENEDFGTAVLTSATLAVSGGFDYIRARLGVRERARTGRAVALRLRAARRSSTCLRTCPTRARRRSRRMAAERIRRLLEITEGRAFCLFTSYAQMHAIYQRLEGELPYPMLLQGTAPKNALLEEFRLTPNAVLFATSSFWQGVDVQGEQLSCVIIDRLPFAVPNDPVVAARSAPSTKPAATHSSIPGPCGGHHAETGLRTADPLARTTAACSACSTTASSRNSTERCSWAACRPISRPPTSRRWRSSSGRRSVPRIACASTRHRPDTMKAGLQAKS